MNYLGKIEKKNIFSELTVDSKSIALVDTTSDKSLQKKMGMKNIFLVTAEYEVVWQVSLVLEESTLEDTFVYMHLNESGDLMAKSFFGMQYVIDINTGSAKKIGWSKC